MPRPYNINQAIKIFQHDVVYFERTTTRSGAGGVVYNDGPDITISGVIQPADLARLNYLPEGQRADVNLLLHTEESLRVAAPTDNPDTNTVIRFGGRKYKIVGFAYYTNQDFYEYAMTGLDE